MNDAFLVGQMVKFKELTQIYTRGQILKIPKDKDLIVSNIFIMPIQNLKGEDVDCQLYIGLEEVNIVIAEEQLIGSIYHRKKDEDEIKSWFGNAGERENLI